MTKAEVTLLVALASSGYQGTQLKSPDEIIKGWQVLLSDIPYDIAKRAVVQACRESRFFPTVADIVAASREIIEVATGSRKPSLEEAWGEVTTQLLRAGLYKKPVFSNLLIAEVVQIMGWLNLCRSENEIADRAHFIKFYSGLLARDVAADRVEETLALTGMGLDMIKSLAEHMNVGGSKRNDPIRIGSGLPEPEQMDEAPLDRASAAERGMALARIGIYPKGEDQPKAAHVQEGENLNSTDVSSDKAKGFR